MKYVMAVTVTAFVFVWYLAGTLLPDPLRYAAGPHAGEVFAEGPGVWFFAFYLAALVAAFAAFLSTSAFGRS